MKGWVFVNFAKALTRDRENQRVLTRLHSIAGAVPQVIQRHVESLAQSHFRSQNNAAMACLRVRCLGSLGEVHALTHSRRFRAGTFGKQ